MYKKSIRLLCSFLCVALFMTVAMPSGIATAESGKKGTFWAYLYGTSDGADTLLRPYFLSKESIDGDGVVLAAKKTATYLKSMPEGRRGIDIHLLSGIIGSNRQNLIWWDNGAQALRDILDPYFAALAKEGVGLDYVIDDLEQEMTNWSINTEAKADLIVKDPRYATEIRPLLEARNFRFGEDGKHELYYMYNYTADKAAYMIWNNTMDCRIADYYNYAVFEPLKKNFPNAKMSNYELFDSKAEIPVTYGSAHRPYVGGPTKKVGTHSSPVCYGTFIHIAYKGRGPEGYPFEYYKATGYNAALVELIKIQDAVLSTEGGKIMPWIGLKSWSNGNYANFWQTNYYDEFVLHTGLMNPDPFLIYNIGAKDQGTDEKLLTKLFNQLDELVGFDNRKPLITKAFSWDQRYLLTGMYAGGKNVWRITPDLYTPGISQESFLINKEKPTFQIGNQVVVFPEGSYIYQPSETISDYGYWVVSPQNTYPEELRIVGMDIPKEPVLGSDKIPTGHTFENDVAKYTPDMQTVSADKAPAAPPANKEPENNNENNTEQTNSGNNNTQVSQAQGHWAQASLDKAVSMGFLKGTDTGLMPDRNIQRAEFITMLLRAMGLETNETVGATWYAGAINAAKDMGWIEPYDDGPTILTREETARILVRAFQIGETSRRVNFTDIDSISADMKDAVLDAASSGMINGYPDGTFKPQGNITRAEAVTMILRCIK